MHGQNVKSIKQKQKKVQKEIEKLNKQIKAAEKNEQQQTKQVSLLSDKITLSETFLEYTCQMIDQLDSMMIENQDRLQSLNIKGDSLQYDYKEALNHSIMMELSVEPMGYLFSLSDINQTNLQKVYFEELQAKAIAHLSTNEMALDSVNMTMTTLLEQRLEKDSLQITEAIVRTELIEAKKRQEKQAKSSTQKSEKLKKSLLQKSKEKEKLARRLKKIIQEEIRLANLAKTKNKKNKKTKTTKVKSLLWPVSERVVLNKFGKHRHPDLKNVTVQNNGIDIQAHHGEDVKSVSTGKVITVTEIPGYQKALIIANEDLYIVYSGLGEINVSKGQSITKDQVLGYVAEGNKETPSRLHLEIWKGKDAIDPMVFLR